MRIVAIREVDGRVEATLSMTQEEAIEVVRPTLFCDVHFKGEEDAGVCEADGCTTAPSWCEAHLDELVAGAQATAEVLEGEKARQSKLVELEELRRACGLLLGALEAERNGRAPHAKKITDTKARALANLLP